jgi:hypothetical protein
MHAWRALLARQDRLNAIHQTPAYFRYLQHTGGAPELILVRDRMRKAIVAALPTSRGSFNLDLNLETRRFGRFRLRSLTLLGNEPALDGGGEALDALFAFLARRRGDADVIQMYAVRREGALWAYINHSPTIRQYFGVYVVGGFRASHSITLPPTVEDYYQKMPRKRRYNLKRQERLLREHFGGRLVLRPLEREEEVPLLLAGFERLGVTVDGGLPVSRAKYEEAARCGVLRTFILSAAERVIGIVSGIRSEDGYFVGDVLFDRSLARFSPGTTLWQMTLRHLIAEGTVGVVGISYGSPAYGFASVNTIEEKGRVLLYRRSALNFLRFSVHGLWARAVQEAKRRTGRTRGNYFQYSDFGSGVFAHGTRREKSLSRDFVHVQLLS